MATAPKGAVARIANTATARISRPIFLSPSSAASSRAMPPIAACTVAFGSHARAAKSRSCQRRPRPPTAAKAMQLRTPRLQNNITRPRPTTRGSNVSTATAAPTRPNSNGCAMWFQTSASLAETALEAVEPHARATATANTSTDNAEAPAKLARFSPKAQHTAMPSNNAMRPRTSTSAAGGVNAATAAAPAVPAATPSTSSSGALTMSNH
mmetsp:Transcript_71972/g.208509  ORF Transcript_71972/g.208509 Transcript_71972/m.208509 type:complete len:210 (+) Transcript_71972:390-1019(+)